MEGRRRFRVWSSALYEPEEAESDERQGRSSPGVTAAAAPVSPSPPRHQQQAPPALPHSAALSSPPTNPPRSGRAAKTSASGSPESRKPAPLSSLLETARTGQMPVTALQMIPVQRTIKLGPLPSMTTVAVERLPRLPREALSGANARLLASAQAGPSPPPQPPLQPPPSAQTATISHDSDNSSETQPLDIPRPVKRERRSKYNASQATLVSEAAVPQRPLKSQKIPRPRSRSSSRELDPRPAAVAAAATIAPPVHGPRSAKDEQDAPRTQRSSDAGAGSADWVSQASVQETQEHRLAKAIVLPAPNAETPKTNAEGIKPTKLLTPRGKEKVEPAEAEKRSSIGSSTPESRPVREAARGARGVQDGARGEQEGAPGRPGRGRAGEAAAGSRHTTSSDSTVSHSPGKGREQILIRNTEQSNLRSNSFFPGNPLRQSPSSIKENEHPHSSKPADGHAADEDTRKLTRRADSLIFASQEHSSPYYLPRPYSYASAAAELERQTDDAAARDSGLEDAAQRIQERETNVRAGKSTRSNAPPTQDDPASSAPSTSSTPRRPAANRERLMPPPTQPNSPISASAVPPREVPRRTASPPRRTNQLFRGVEAMSPSSEDDDGVVEARAVVRFPRRPPPVPDPPPPVPLNPFFPLFPGLRSMAAGSGTRVELHAHLVGSLRAETIWELMKSKKMQLPGNGSLQAMRDSIVFKAPVGILNYREQLPKYLPAVAGDVQALERVAYEFCEDKVKQGVLYVEARYCPHLLVSPNVRKEKLSQELCNVVSAVNRGFSTAENKLGITVRTILSVIIGMDIAKEIIGLCQFFRNDGVVGIDLMLPHYDAQRRHDLKYVIYEEVPLTLEELKTFETASYLNINRTIHAGEIGSASMVERAVENYRAQRVGHGYEVVRKLDVYDKCRERNVHFECCPWDSILSGAVYSGVKEHPVARFAQDGVNFSLNNSYPTLTGRTLQDTYDLAYSWGLNEAHIVRSNINAMRSSFIPSPDKEKLMQKLLENIGIRKRGSKVPN